MRSSNAPKEHMLVFSMYANNEIDIGNMYMYPTLKRNLVR